ncbi:MAG: NAD(P)-dependent oxidoreductase [Verrucomicrobia bacterium]|nr:NAD(P)-dependent oxidoreductase [Verrucomicrobiota bacterium]
MKFLVTGGTGFIGRRVVRNLLARGLPVVVAETAVDGEIAARLSPPGGGLPGADFLTVDVSDQQSLMSVFQKHADVTHCIHLAYLPSAAVEAEPQRSAQVNVVGTINLFEAALQYKLSRLVFASSGTVYGAHQTVYGDRSVKEDDYCGPQHHFFTYGMMKLLNEFMAQKYAQKHGIRVAALRPPLVFGHGRRDGAIAWAEQFASMPAIGKQVVLPFPETTRDSWIYVDDCAEQLARLSLKPQIGHLAYNSGGESVMARQLAEMVKHWLPDAQIAFDETKPPTPLIDCMDGRRLEQEIGFRPRPLMDGVRAHINEARAAAGLRPV